LGEGVARRHLGRALVGHPQSHLRRGADCPGRHGPPVLVAWPASIASAGSCRPRSGPLGQGADADCSARSGVRGTPCRTRPYMTERRQVDRRLGRGSGAG
jgi:hypothetical protein